MWRWLVLAIYRSFSGDSDIWQRICLQCRRPEFNPWVGKIPWRREWQLTSLFMPGKFHGQRSLVGYSPWGHKEVDMTERLTLSTFNNVSNNANYSFVIFLSSFFFFFEESYQIWRLICNPNKCKTSWPEMLGSHKVGKKNLKIC